MIKLTKLTMQNFLSHANSEIELPTYDGLTLIEGKTYDGRYSSNGSGKSTIIEGIYYAFTGKTLRGLTSDAVVNRQADKDTVVTLQFRSNHSTYIVSRYRKHSQFGNDLKLFKDGEDISRRTATETQSVLDEIIELPNDILSSIMIMGEGMTSRFTQLSDPDKKKLLENTIRLSHSIDNAREETKNRLKKVDQDIQYKSGLIDAHKKVIEDQRAIQQIDINDMNSKMSAAQFNLGKIDEELQGLGQQIEPLIGKIRVLDKAITDYDQLLRSKASNDQSIETLKVKLQDVLSDIPVCPMCHQLLSDPTEVKNHLNKELSDLENKDREYQEGMSKIPDIEIVRNKRAELNMNLSEMMTRQMSLNSMRPRVVKEIEEYSRVITGYNQSEDTIVKLEEENKVLFDELTSLSKNKERLEYISKSIFSPTGVIVNILGSVVNYVDQRLQVYTNLLLDKVFHITFKRGKISLESTGNTYQSLSNGEKRRLDISIQFAIHDYIYTHCGIGFDTMFIDEILDTLDSVGVTNIIEVLNLKKSYCSMDRIFIVTHNDELKDYFDSILSVSKDANGITTLS